MTGIAGDRSSPLAPGIAPAESKRGPRNASLEQCDLGLGPGRLEGATTRLPRYFPDTDKVQDLESRLLTCMVQLQGFNREDIVKRAISPAGSSGSDVEALAIYITSRSGAGDRIQGGKLEQRKANGGLCQNCHALAPGEINVGNVGPSLTGYEST